MNLEVVHGLTLARLLYQLGTANLKFSNDTHLFAAVNLLHDAVEAFLIAVAHHVDATIEHDTKFDKYFTLIEAKISSKLPSKTHLLKLNHIRNGSKHKGIQPDRRECDRLAIIVKAFFDDVADTAVGVSFSTVSAIDLLDDGEVKDTLLEAKSSFEKRDFESATIACRKAIYLEIERPYCVDVFRPGGEVERNDLLYKAFSKAPSYALGYDYYDQHVGDPTDFVVFDRSVLNQELLALGVDSETFWNLWRLTPEVHKSGENWLVKHDFAKLDSAFLTDNIEYILDTTVNILLAIHAKRRGVRQSSHDLYFLNLARDGVTIYRKADKNSQPIGTTPQGLRQIETDFRVPGFAGEGPYWHVINIKKGSLFIGYVHNDDVTGLA